MIGQLIVSLLLLAGDVEVQVVPLHGAPLRGTLKEISAERLVITSEGAETAWQTDKVRRVDVGAPASSSTEAARGSIELVLTDGSRLLASSFLLQRGEAKAELLNQRAITLKTSMLRHVRLQDFGNNETLQQQWRDFTNESPSHDLLVYRRDDGAAGRLDALEGVLLEAGPELMTFEYEGERIQPRRERVAGLVFFHPAAASRPAEAKCQIADRHGLRWNVTALHSDGDQLRWTTAAGVEGSAPWVDILTLDFAAGNLAYLSDLQPESVVWRPFIDSKIPPKLLEPRYAPRFDEAFDGGPLLLGDTSYSKGLALHSYSDVTYRIPAGFRRFRAVAGLDDRVRRSGVTSGVRLRILRDADEVYNEVLSADLPPVDLDVDITRGKRLRIIVEYGENLDISDYLDLGEARLTK